MKTTLLIIGFICLELNLRAQIVDSFNRIDYAKEVVRVLASDGMKGRLAGTKDADSAGVYIFDQLQSLKAFSVYKQAFEFKTKGKTVESNNIVAVLQGKSKKDEIVVFSAHYDHIGTIFSTIPSSVNSKKIDSTDSVYNGANDNASGVAGLLLLAKWFAVANNNERTIVLAFFSAEEFGLNGSTSFVNLIQRQKIICNINFDMIGKKSGETLSPFISGSEFSNLRQILNKTLAKDEQKRFGKNFFKKDGYVGQNLYLRSDNYSFVRERIVGHTVMLTSPTDKYYHSVKDEPNTLDYDALVKIAEAVFVGSSSIISGHESPISWRE